MKTASVVGMTFVIGFTFGLIVSVLMVHFLQKSPRECDPFQALDGLPTYFECVMARKKRG